jgi:hypothetical protein
VRAANTRAAINFALLDNEFHDLEDILRNYDYEVRAQDLLEPPLRKTQASTFALQQFDLVNPDTDELLTGNRWVQLALPQ